MNYLKEYFSLPKNDIANMKAKFRKSIFQFATAVKFQL